MVNYNRGRGGKEGWQKGAERYLESFTKFRSENINLFSGKHTAVLDLTESSYQGD